MQQSDSWYAWYPTATKAVHAAHRQCQRWGSTYWFVWRVTSKGYLIGTVNTHTEAKLVCRVSILGKIKNLIGSKADD